MPRQHRGVLVVLALFLVLCGGCSQEPGQELQGKQQDGKTWWLEIQGYNSWYECSEEVADKVEVGKRYYFGFACEKPGGFFSSPVWRIISAQPVSDTKP